MEETVAIGISMYDFEFTPVQVQTKTNLPIIAAS